MDSNNLTLQIEELEVLASIYGEDFESDNPHSCSIKICENSIEATLTAIFPPEYPSDSPPKYEFSAPSIGRKEKENLHRCLDEVYLDNIGGTVIFQWVEKIREKLQAIKVKKTPSPKAKIQIVDNEVSPPNLDVKCPEITHGEVITDRKSSFQGHAAIVNSVEEVNAVLSKLRENKKILNATHNMYAYRIEKKTSKGVVMLQDCEDDGEAHASGRMLHLLQILDQRNVLVVVSRWYGGIQLGPDRFRHINNASRQALVQAGLLKS